LIGQAADGMLIADMTVGMSINDITIGALSGDPTIGILIGDVTIRVSIRDTPIGISIGVSRNPGRGWRRHNHRNIDRRRNNPRRSTPCVDTARSAAHVSGLAASMRAGFWQAFKPYRSRIAACLLPPRNASTHVVDLRGTANAFPSTYRETRGAGWRRHNHRHNDQRRNNPVDPRHAWMRRAARRMCPGWRH